MMRFPNLSYAIHWSVNRLKDEGEDVDSGRWQGVPTEGKPDLVTEEILNLNWSALMPTTADGAEEETRCNMPWTEDHFQERVSRVPSNPGEQYLNWPWWHPTKENKARDVAEGNITSFKFTHTYQERFWPKQAGEKLMHGKYSGHHKPMDSVFYDHHPLFGIRYRYGDLDDVLQLLHDHPQTRQATFPIFFPEDTGAVHGGRVPCTLHYHFLRRGDLLHLWYPIRSCDAVRHFRDDIYLATRLCQWVLDELKLTSIDRWHGVTPGYLHFTAYSFHVHKGDLHLL